MTTTDLLARQVDRRGDRPALVVDDLVLSFADLDGRARRAARALRSLGLGRGDRLALAAGNRAEWVEVFFAASRLGAVLVPLSPRLRRAELAVMLAHCRPAAVVFERGVRDELLAALPPADAPVLAEMDPGNGTDPDPPAPGTVAWAAAVAGADAGDEAADLHPGDLHSICYTSGTTGAPRGAVLTHANVVRGTHDASRAAFDYTAGDVFLNPAPFAHRAGWARLVQSVGAGAAHVLLRRFDAEALCQAIERHRVTVAGLVPTMIRLIDRSGAAARHRTSSLRAIITTAEACPPALRRRVAGLFPTAALWSLYASTEAGQIAVLAPADQQRRPDATGWPAPGVEVRIVDEAGRALGPGETGEIAVRTGEPGTAGVMLGYWTGAGIDAACFEDGWLRTGDCGHLDADGCLTLTDRRRDIIVSGGLNVASREVEDALALHPAVAEVAVVSVPDATWGESIVAVVVAAAGAAPDEAALIEHCRDRLASYKKPRRVEFVDALPRNAAGKVLKYRLRDRLTGAAAPGGGARPAGSGDA